MLRAYVLHGNGNSHVFTSNCLSRKRSDSNSTCSFRLREFMQKNSIEIDSDKIVLSIKMVTVLGKLRSKLHAGYVLLFLIIDILRH